MQWLSARGPLSVWWFLLLNSLRLKAYKGQCTTNIKREAEQETNPLLVFCSVQNGFILCPPSV